MILTVTLVVYGKTADSMEIEARRRLTLLLGPERDENGHVRWRIRPATLIANSVEVLTATGEVENVDVNWRGEFQADTIE